MITESKLKEALSLIRTVCIEAGECEECLLHDCENENLCGITKQSPCLWKVKGQTDTIFVSSNCD